MCVGFWSVDVPPSPKFQFQLVGVPVDVSVNVTESGAVPEVGVPVKLATDGCVRYRMMTIPEPPVELIPSVGVAGAL